MVRVDLDLIADSASNEWPVFVEVKATIIAIIGAKAAAIADVGATFIVIVATFIAIVAFTRAIAVVVAFVDRVVLGLGHFEEGFIKAIITAG